MLPTGFHHQPSSVLSVVIVKVEIQMNTGNRRCRPMSLPAWRSLCGHSPSSRCRRRSFALAIGRVIFVNQSPHGAECQRLGFLSTLASNVSILSFAFRAVHVIRRWAQMAASSPRWCLSSSRRIEPGDRDAVTHHDRCAESKNAWL